MAAQVPILEEGKKIKIDSQEPIGKHGNYLNFLPDQILA
jgi:hypothetical protein